MLARYTGARDGGRARSACYAGGRHDGGVSGGGVWRRWCGASRGARVLVVGDLMLDQFVWGDVERISPEAPVPVVQVRRARKRRPGGAGNVVSNVVALGGRAGACGLVGRRRGRARALRAALRGLGGRHRRRRAERAVATTAKTRIIAHHQQVVRLDHEADAGGDAGARRATRCATWVLRTAARSADVVVVSDYGKGVVAPELLGGAGRAAHARAASPTSSTRSAPTSRTTAARPW